MGVGLKKPSKTLEALVKKLRRIEIKGSIINVGVRLAEPDPIVIKKS